MSPSMFFYAFPVRFVPLKRGGELSAGRRSKHDVLLCSDKYLTMTRNALHIPCSSENKPLRRGLANTGLFTAAHRLLWGEASPVTVGPVPHPTQRVARSLL